MSMHSELQSIAEGENDQEDECESPKESKDKNRSSNLKPSFEIKIQVTQQPDYEKKPIAVNPV